MANQLITLIYSKSKRFINWSANFWSNKQRAFWRVHWGQCQHKWSVGLNVQTKETLWTDIVNEGANSKWLTHLNFHRRHKYIFKYQGRDSRWFQTYIVDSCLSADMKWVWLSVTFSDQLICSVVSALSIWIERDIESSRWINWLSCYHCEWSEWLRRRREIGRVRRVRSIILSHH